MVNGFPYSVDDPKPPSITIISGKLQIRFSAAEIMTFMRSLSLVIGHIIPKNDEYWKLYILLKQITDLCMAESLQRVFSFTLSAYIRTPCIVPLSPVVSVKSQASPHDALSDVLRTKWTSSPAMVLAF